MSPMNRKAQSTPGRERSASRIDYNPAGKWSVASVTARYAALRVQLGGTSDFALQPRVYTNPGGMTWIYNIMEGVADGVQRGDQACIELAIGYIEDNIMASYTGYIRERMARSLRRAPLSKSQQTRLANVFLSQLISGNLHKEYREYIRLFRTMGVADFRTTIEKQRASAKAYIRRAAERLLA
jgi:hypothetical protein